MVERATKKTNRTSTSKPGAAKPSADKPVSGRAKTVTSTAGRAAKASMPAGRKTAAKAKETIAEAQHGIQLGFLSEFLGFHLRLAQDASSRAFSRQLDADLLKPGRFPALAIIHLNPGISQSALGRAIARDKSTVSPLIKDLQTNGFISRKPSPRDGRSVTLALTKKGERTLDKLRAGATEHEAELDAIVGASKGRLMGMLQKIIDAMGD